MIIILLMGLAEDKTYCLKLQTGMRRSNQFVDHFSEIRLQIFQVVSALLDFLYTGEMTVDRCDTADLQRLIETLQISPELISVDVIVEKPVENVVKGGDENQGLESGEENVDKTADGDDDDDGAVTSGGSGSDDADADGQANDGSSEDSVTKPTAQKRKLELEDESSKKPRS